MGILPMLEADEVPLSENTGKMPVPRRCAVVLVLPGGCGYDDRVVSELSACGACR